MRRTLLAALILSLPALPPARLLVVTAAAQQAQPPAQQQRLVEDVQIQGNRRNRKEDLLYYVQTRPGDAYNRTQIERDFRTLMDLGFFQRTESRVEEEEGPRGGVIVTFVVKELPIIRDLQFEGLSSVTESDILKTLRERRIRVSKENVSDPVQVNNAVRVLKELLAAKGHPNATVEVRRDEVSATSEAVTFVIDEGDRVRVVDVQFEGNQHFSDGELRGAMKYVKEAGLLTRFKEQDILDREKLDVDMRLVRNHMAAKGYLQARVGDPRIESLGPKRTGFPVLPLPILSSTDEGLRITIPVTEGKLFRLGDVKIEGNSIYSEQVIRGVIGLNKGDVASGERIYKGLFEDLKKIYGNSGFIQYSADAEPTFKDNPANPAEGVADYTITIEEGKQFTLRRLEFQGNTFTRDNVLRREFVLNEGDTYNQSYVEYSVLRLNQLGFFDPVDKDKDVDFRQDEESAEVDVNVKVAERGRQQITFNGGLSGIGGSFFGFDYSTNNLLGRGESLSFQLASGNRQQSFVFSFTEPYIRNRPITAGFSLFLQTVKFFGEGTFLSGNVNALQGISGNQLDFFNTSEENLFTQRTMGGSLFVSAPLTEFYKRKTPFTISTRVGMTYSFSRTSVRDPEVNLDPANTQNFIPVLYRQPNITTSRVTPTLVFDSRDMRGVDAVNGQQLTAALAFAGLGGDVRTYQPTISYQRFIPVRNKRAKIPQVFGFRLLAGHVGSFATSSKVRSAQETSISFINGVPIYERFFLGDEFSIRGYPPRAITPLVPLEQFVTSRGVVVAANPSGTPTPIPELARFASLGEFSGTTGPNARLISSGYQPIGADTELLGNFEYRIPIFGMLSAAAYADIGTVFNLRKGRDQVFSSSFQPDSPFLPSTLGLISCPSSPFGGVAAASLSALAACRNESSLALSLAGGLVARDGRLVTREELDNARRAGPVGPDGLPFGFDSVFLRGEAQTNTAVRLSQSVFSKFSDFRSSLGGELRIQLPVVNVPFRLIYAFNPQARRGLNSRVPLIFDEDRSTFRFSIGRTF